MQIAQDDDGFEIASIRDSFDIDLEDPASAGGLNGSKPPPYDAPSQNFRRDASPLPAPVPQKPSPLQRRSLEADTMFALDDEDRSDDDDFEEGKRLTGGKAD
jgi:hypothetical protein